MTYPNTLPEFPASSLRETSGVERTSRSFASETLSTRGCPSARPIFGHPRAGGLGGKHDMGRHYEAMQERERQHREARQMWILFIAMMALALPMLALTATGYTDTLRAHVQEWRSQR